MYCINIHMTVNSFTFSTVCICKLLYTNVTRYKNKPYNRMFFWYEFYGFDDIFHAYKETHPKFNNAN